jgi:hypothetical protein
LALLSRQKRIARLGHSGMKDILATNVNALAHNAAELVVEPGWVLPGQLFDASNPEKLKVPQHGWPDGNQVL